jgi:hypothetical protein
VSLTWRLYRDDGQIKLFPFTVIAKIAPYQLASGTLPLLATGTTGRMASPVTQTPSILYMNRAIPNFIEFKKEE